MMKNVIYVLEIKDQMVISIQIMIKLTLVFTYYRIKALIYFKIKYFVNDFSAVYPQNVKAPSEPNPLIKVSNNLLYILKV